MAKNKNIEKLLIDRPDLFEVQMAMIYLIESDKKAGIQQNGK